ncbi:hypothetical protein JI57_01040 [Psychromonas sp. PRT-SC03]|nr:hypothetical protein JI57_01040 [Psychromonas sp. PRT-SC03]
MRYLLLSLVLFSMASTANPFRDKANIAVSGNAVLEVKADLVVINFNANAINKSALIAKQKVDKKIFNLLENLKKSGFSKDLLVSLSQRSTPEYKYVKNKRVLVGVRVSHELSYRLTAIDKVNDFIDSVLKSNIDTISTLKYGLQDAQKWQAKVRKMAVLDSQQKASNLASLYQAKLGKVYSINYQNNQPMPISLRNVQMSLKSGGLNVAPKKIKITDHVNVHFILKP